MPSNYCKDVTVVGENDLGHDWQVQLAPKFGVKEMAYVVSIDLFIKEFALMSALCNFFKLPFEMQKAIFSSKIEERFYAIELIHKKSVIQLAGLSHSFGCKAKGFGWLGAVLMLLGACCALEGGIVAWNHQPFGFEWLMCGSGICLAGSFFLGLADRFWCAVDVLAELATDCVEEEEAARIMEDSPSAISWSEEAVLSGRSLRRFDLLAMRILGWRDDDARASARLQ